MNDKRYSYFWEAQSQMTMKTFKSIYKKACQRKGGDAALEALLPTPKSAKALRAQPDDRYFSLMSLRVFSAGLKHSMVLGKWPDFEVSRTRFPWTQNWLNRSVQGGPEHDR